MLSIWLFIFALAICSLAKAEDDYDYDGLVSEEPIQVIVYENDGLYLTLFTLFVNQTVYSVH